MRRVRNAEEKIWSNVLSEFEITQEHYRTMFGVHSLDYVDICNPLNIDIAEMKKGIRRLRWAMHIGKPYPNNPPLPGIVY